MKEESWRNDSETYFPLFFDEELVFRTQKALRVCKCSKITIENFVFSKTKNKIRFIFFWIPHAFSKCHFSNYHEYGVFRAHIFLNECKNENFVFERTTHVRAGFSPPTQSSSTPYSYAVLALLHLAFIKLLALPRRRPSQIIKKFRPKLACRSVTPALSFYIFI